MKAMRMVLGLVVVVAAATGGQAEAGSTQSNLGVSAQVNPTCTINAGAMSFGTYDAVAGTQVDGQATVQVACTKGATAVITLGQGLNPTGTSTDGAPERRMASGSQRLAYSLFSDSSRSATWGNTSGSSVGYTSTTSAASQLTVYGRITGGQDVTAGSYSDTVVATISF